MSNGILKFLCVLIALILLLPGIFTGDLFAQSKAEKIDELMTEYFMLKQFNGSVLVAEHGKLIFKKGYGLANMEWNIPNAPDTKFRLGSVTKQFTSMVIMQLVAEGKISLQGKLSDYLNDYRKDTGQIITIHHLLTHTAGIPSYTDLTEFVDEIRGKSFEVKDFVKRFCSKDPEFEPGTKYKYSNSGYFLLGAVIEAVTGKTYEAALTEEIFKPLNMKNTGYDYHHTILSHRASAYEKTLEGYKNAPYINMMPPFAAGALYSTVEDLFKWNQALYTNKLLDAKQKEKMFTPYLQNYAYGWIIAKGPGGKKAIVHGGGITGFNTLLVRLVEDKHFIVLLNNTGATNLNEMAIGINLILFDMEYELPKKPVNEILFEIIAREGISTAMKKFNEIKSEGRINSSTLNRLGYMLLRQDRIDEAIEIFKLNVETFPDEFNPYDSLGEAYMVKGEKILAIKNYEKSLELNPDNTGAVEMLKKLRND